MSAVGYIGLGQMGAAMATRLLDVRGELVAFDLAPEPLAAVAERGARLAGSPADVARHCEVVSICVPAAQHVDAVLFGDEGIVSAGRPCTVLVHSTVHPHTITGARDRAVDQGVSVFDACVAGGGAAAATGDLVIFSGGWAELPGEARDLLQVYGSKVIDAGRVGAGAALKIAVNVMTYAQQAAAAAAFSLVEVDGGDPAALVEAWRHTGQLGRLTEQFLPMLSIDPADVTGDFRRYIEGTVGIARKDLDLALELGEQTVGGPSALIAAVRDALPEVFRLNAPGESR